MSGPNSPNLPSCPPETACNCGSNDYYFKATGCSLSPWNCKLLTGSSGWTFPGGAYSILMTCSGGQYTVTLGLANAWCQDGQGAGGASFSFRPNKDQCKFKWSAKMEPTVRATCVNCGGVTFQGQIIHSSFGCT